LQVADWNAQWTSGELVVRISQLIAHPALFETRHRRKDGVILHVEINAVGVTLQGHNYLYSSSRDITERKQIESAEQEQRFLLSAEINERQLAEEKLFKQNEVLSALYENMLDILQFQELDALLQLFVVKAAAQVDAPYSELALLENDELVIRATTPNQNHILGNRAGLEDARLSWQTVQTRQPVILDDYAVWPYRRAIYDNTPTHAIISYPILIGERCIGVFDLSRDRPDYPFTPEEIQIGNLFVRLVALGIENSRLYEELHASSVTDALTGLYNRRGLFQFGEHEVERSLRFDRPLSVVMFDLDHFKNVNDTYGHPVGDHVLVEIAKCCTNQLRTVDIAARYGGDEFVLILPEASLEDAAQVAERLRDSIEKIVIIAEPKAGGSTRTLRVTASLGVVRLISSSSNLADTISAADSMLYEAKQSGRNRVSVQPTLL
jgi:diguanylate cyclase (GGDEF)-like protein